MTTTSVEFEFICGPGSKLSYHHGLPTSLIQAALSGTSQAFRQAYVQSVAPIMQQHQQECLKATQSNCSVCDVAKTKQVLTTPMSYLHVKDDPKIVVLVTPICEKQQCETAGKAMVNELVMETTGLQQGQVNRETTPRNAHCPCGSSRKYKKCCGSATANDDVD